MAAPNKAWMRAEQDRRRSAVARPHRNRTKYRRADAKRVTRTETREAR